MSLSVTAALELSPRAIAGSTSVILRYSVGSRRPSRACDRIVVGGEERPERECFDVTGTVTAKQLERRQIQVDAPAGVDFVRVEVFVQEFDAANQPIGREKRCSAMLRIDG